jgi:hypothetical protein
MLPRVPRKEVYPTESVGTCGRLEGEVDMGDDLAKVLAHDRRLAAIQREHEPPDGYRGSGDWLDVTSIRDLPRRRFLNLRTGEERVGEGPIPLTGQG